MRPGLQSASHRKCGDCQLCCTVMPVEEIDKRAHTRCRHQRHGKGCAVYHRPGMPRSCAVWNCRWLVDDEHHDLARPDRAHFVIDIMPDIIRATDNKTGEEHEISVIVVWCERGHDDAHHDPSLRRYVERSGQPMLVRFYGGDAMVVVPPGRREGNKEGWLEYPRSAPSPTFKGFVQRLRDNHPVVKW